MGLFERYLSVWVGLAIIFGIAVLIWLMIFPMMVQIDFGSIRNVAREPKGLVLTLVINWLIKPFTMRFLAGYFSKVFLPTGSIHKQQLNTSLA